MLILDDSKPRKWLKKAKTVTSARLIPIHDLPPKGVIGSRGDPSPVASTLGGYAMAGIICPYGMKKMTFRFQQRFRIASDLL